MIRIYKNILLYFIIFTCLPGLFSKKSPAWNAPLKQAPELTHGILPNGMHYYIYPHASPKGFISLRLMVNAGAAMENETNDGIAHFIEHMTFNGTKNFKPGTLIHYFQDNGMGFGNDTNAFTHYLYTCYQIDLPHNDNAELIKGLKVLWDQAFGCLFLPEEIERERGVILSEMRTHDSILYRSYKAMSKFLYPDSLLSKRFIIGVEDTINSFTSKHFFDFYNQWYKPHRMSIIVTGDLNKRDVLKHIKAAFATPQKEKNNTSTLSNPDFGPISSPKDKLEVSIFSNKELPETTLYLQAQRYLMPRSHLTLNDLKESVAWELIEIILKQRLAELKNKTCINDFQVNRDKSFQSIDRCRLSLSGNKDTLTILIQEFEKFHRNVTTFGFSQQELEGAKTILTGRALNTSTEWKNTSSSAVADSIVDELMWNSIFLSPQQHETYLHEVLPYITPEYCASLWNNLWNDGSFLFVSGPLPDDVTAESIKKIFLESQKTVLKLPETLKKHEFLSPYGGNTQAKIIDRSFNEKLQIESLRLSNQVRINLKQTNFDKDRILIHVGVGSGLLSLKNTSYPGIHLLLDSSFIAGGLKQCDRNTLNRIFDGKMINLDFDVEDDCFAFKCITDRKCLMEQLQLIGAYLIEPGYRPEGLDDFKKNIPPWYDYFDKTIEGIFISKVVNFMNNNDNRFGYPEQSILLQRNFDEAKKLLTPIFDKQYLEISIVGDFDRTAIINQLLATFGKLQDREMQKNCNHEAKTLPWPQAQTKIFTCHTELDKATLYIVWPTKATNDAKTLRNLNILRSVLQNRLLQEIRQILGDTYSPQVAQKQNSVFDRGFISAFLTVAPSKLDVIADKTMSIADDIAKNGISQDELNRAIKPIITSLEKKIGTNKFWIHWLANWQSQPQKINWALNDVKAYESISKTEVEAVAKSCLQRNSAICVQIKPDKSQK